MSEEQKTFFSYDYSDFWPFIDNLNICRDKIFHDIEEQCKKYNVYTIGPWFGKLLNFFIRFGNVSSVLEFGCAIGYSAIWMEKALPQNGSLTTIENDAQLSKVAEANFHKADVAEKITILNIDAEKLEEGKKRKYDLIFVDCAHHIALKNSKTLLKKNGLFICDNVGLTNKESFNKPLTECPYLETIYLQCYLKGRIPENTAFSISIKL